LVPYYEFDDDRFFESDGAAPAVAAQRRAGVARLSTTLAREAAGAIERTDARAPLIPRLPFTPPDSLPLPHPRQLDPPPKVGAFLRESDGVRLTDIDGHVSYDLTGSYGVNLFGYDFYKECIDAGIQRVRDLGPLLGSYHPLVEDNVRRLRAISGMDEVSFHM